MNNKSKIDDMEIVISKSLRTGIIISGIVIFCGLLMFFITGKSGYKGGYYPTKPMEILQGVLSLKAYAIILLGLMLLILTPVFRVAVSIILFFKEKDFLYVKITSFVLIVLIVSFIIGKVE